MIIFYPKRVLIIIINYKIVLFENSLINKQLQFENSRFRTVIKTSIL